MSATETALTPRSMAAGRLDASPGDPLLGTDLLAHLDTQLESAHRLLVIVLTQADAIRRRAVREVVIAAGELQVEMHRRELLERERLGLMQRAARHLALAPDAIGFTSVQRLMDAPTANAARTRTQELTRLLTRIDREHTLNRTLMAQELAFLDHLLGMADGVGAYVAHPGATANGNGNGDGSRVRRTANVARRRVFDLEA